MFKRLFELNHKLTTERPKTILAIALVVTIIAIVFAAGLKLELNWVALAPKGSEAVSEYERILEDFPTMDTVMVIIEADDHELLEAAAYDIGSEMEKLTDYVDSVTVGVDQDYVLDYALNFLPEEEVEAIGYLLADPNMDTFYAGIGMMVQGISDELNDDGLEAEDRKMLEGTLRALDGIVRTTSGGLNGDMNDEQTSRAYKKYLTDFMSGEALMTSENGKMTMVTIMPTFDILDLLKLEPGVEAMEKVVFDAREKYPDVTIGITGMHVVARDETVSVTEDSQVTTLLAVVLILALLYVAFRAFSAPILTFLPLLFGIIWDIGIIRLLVGRLNMITVFSAAMIIGLGVDYAIHLYSAYTEHRSEGCNKSKAMYRAMLLTGPSIIVGGLTTAMAFLALNFSQLEMLGELGTVMGVGIGTTMVAVFWVLPCMIILRKEKEKSIKKIKGNYPSVGRFALGVRRFRYLVLALLIASSAFLGYKATEIQFDMNLLNLEPLGLESIELMEHLVEEYDMSATSLSVGVDSIEEVYRVAGEFAKVDGVAEVTSILSVMPEDHKQEIYDNNANKLDDLMATQMPARTADMMYVQMGIDGLKTATADLDAKDIGINDKYVKNLIYSLTLLELTAAEADSENLATVSSIFYDTFKDIGDQIADGEFLTIEDIPGAYSDQFISQSGERFLISVFPDFEIWENLKSEKGQNFIDDLSEIAPSITGVPLFMKILYDTASDEAMQIGLILIGVLAVILVIHFRSIRYALLAFIPLMFTLISTVGTMVLVRLDFNILNFLGLLLIIGIGVDYGVHIIHHYLDGREDIDKVFASVGRAILLTSVTTMFGFGSLITSSYRGIATLGAVLLIGVGYAFVMTVIILPVFLKEK